MKMQVMKKIHPPTHLLIYIVVSVLLHFLYPLHQLIRFPYTLLGIILIAAGAVLNVWADGIFKKQNTTVKPFEKPDALVNSGPYRISRNPMYLGMVLILFGVSFILGSLISFAGPIFFIIAMERVFIPEEEKSMKENFGDEYFIYKRKIRKWI